MRGGYHGIGYSWQQFSNNPGRRPMYVTPEEKRAYQIGKARDRRRALRGCEDPNGPVRASVPPPPEVQIEYAIAVAQPRSITAEQFGDPLPGRSALDKMRVREDA